MVLERKSAADRFHLSWLQEDASENLSLAAKLKSDFSLAMPEFKGEDDFNPQEYIQQVAQVVSTQEKWEVLPDAMVLGFFSFAKFLMYRDLDPGNWPLDRAIDKQRLISAVMQDGFPAKDRLFPDETHVDRVVPVDTQRHVVDSDSSQTLAIDAVRRGEDLVIQGPPGTGKSQTNGINGSRETFVVSCARTWLGRRGSSVQSYQSHCADTTIPRHLLPIGCICHGIENSH